MTTDEAITKLEQWQAEIIHGPMSFQGIIDVIKKQQALLQEVRSWHSCPDMDLYNECDTAPCNWCERVIELNRL